MNKLTQEQINDLIECVELGKSAIAGLEKFIQYERKTRSTQTTSVNGWSLEAIWAAGQKDAIKAEIEIWGGQINDS